MGRRGNTGVLVHARRKPDEYAVRVVCDVVADQLGVLGADVIRVEHPYQVDLARQLGPDVALNERLLGTGYLTQGSKKCSLSLDLRNDLGREVFRRLLGEADVLVENFRPGALDALDLGYDHVRKVNPSLIYVSLSTFGHTGDKRTYRGYDHNVQAPSGMMAMTRQHPTLARRARWRVRSVGRLSTGPTDRRGWADKERGLRTVAARRPSRSERSPAIVGRVWLGVAAR